MQRQQKPTSWRYSLGESIFFFGVSVWLFRDFTDFEKSGGGEGEMNWIIATLYNIGGKWLVCAVVAAIGLICLVEAKHKCARR